MEITHHTRADTAHNKYTTQLNSMNVTLVAKGGPTLEL